MNERTDAPARLLPLFSGEAFIRDATLHLSRKALGNPDLGALLFSARRSGLEQRWHNALEFQEYHQKDATQTRMQDNALQRYVVRLFETAYARKAQDIHVILSGVTTSIRFRILGDLEDVDRRDAAFGEALMALLYNFFAQQTGRAVFSHSRRLDGRIIHPGVLPKGVWAVRLHAEPIEAGARESGVFMALRLLYDATGAGGSLDERLEHLGYNAVQRRDLARLTLGRGLTLVSGQTGHGKSTLLKHIFESLVRQEPEKSYLSVEDPPEYHIQGVQQVHVAGRESDTDRRTCYREALAGALRADPDVLMIGEIRFAEAAETAVTAALTGHGVWASIHAHDAFSCVSRMAALLGELGISDGLSRITEESVLSGLIHQTLVPLLCTRCRLPFSDADGGRAARLAAYFSESPFLKENRTSFYLRGRGCRACGFRGSTALTAVAEVVRLTPELLRIVREEGLYRARLAFTEDGGIDLLSHAREKVLSGLADPLDMMRRTGRIL
ncbi:MAG: Flp pilus assembly complex ATPase component TadA [Desulfovibrio sp.]|nr:Flp pilus assembly complex ATPase component TadA [Desulfovibrio sp.]